MPLCRETGERIDSGSPGLVTAGGVLATKSAVSVGDSLPRILMEAMLAFTSTTVSLLITMFIFIACFYITLSLGSWFPPGCMTLWWLRNSS